MQHVAMSTTLGSESAAVVGYLKMAPHSYIYIDEQQNGIAVYYTATDIFTDLVLLLKDTLLKLKC